MSNPHCRRFSVALLVVLAASLSYTQAQDQSSPLPAKSTHAQMSGFSRRDLMRLRPVLLRDLVPMVKRAYNDPNPSPAGVQDAFLSCRFTPLRLGKLGPVVLVEWDGWSHGPNVPMLNIYAPTGNSYQKIIAESGFGPSIVPGTGSSVPDMLFGGTSGVCHASYDRYRYTSDKYEVDACDQEYPTDSAGSCQIRPCDHMTHPLPTFPDPTSWNGPPNTSAPYFDGPTLSAKQILSTKH